ncbi:MAG: ligase-associated DNA damage response endonuclease PdeM [Steroidobacteraceae bacterium]
MEPPGILALEIRGERLLLHPVRAVVWPARRTVIVADTHFGKSSVFGRHGIAVPDGTDAYDRERLAALLAQTQAQRLLLLGDFLHGALDAQQGAARDLALWLRRLRGVCVALVTGNHDRTAAAGWQAPVNWQGDELIDGPFRFTHEDLNDSQHFVISGHVHPVVTLRGLRKHRLRVPVFWERAGGLVLPSFGSFTGGYRVEPQGEERVYAAGPETVVELKVARRARP